LKTHTHNLLGIGKVTTFVANNLNLSIKSVIYLLHLKAKRVTLVSMWFIGGDLGNIFRSTTSFLISVVNL
jgi:hypothetical protein